MKHPPRRIIRPTGQGIGRRTGRHLGHRTASGICIALATALVALSVAVPGSSGAALRGHSGSVDPGRWRLVTKTGISIYDYQGMAEGTGGRIYFDGVDNGLWMDTRRFHQLAGWTPYIPKKVAARDKYNHIGAIAFDKSVGVLLPMECYNGTNCANTGAIGVANPSTLRWRYEVKLNSASIKKAMWAAVSPDGKLLWTSSNSDLLAYSMSDISRAHSWPAHGAISPVRVLKGAVPPSGVTGGTFYQGRLYLAGSVGNDMQVWSIDVANGTRRLEISRHIIGETEGIAAFDAGKVHSVDRCRSDCVVANPPPNHFGGILHWMVQPQPDGNTPPTYKAPTILSFVPTTS